MEQSIPAHIISTMVFSHMIGLLHHTAAKPIFDADNRGQDMEKKVRLLVLVLSHRLEILWDLEWEVLLILWELIWEDLVWKDLEWEDMIWEDSMGGHGMGGYDMGGHGMGGHGMGGPKGKRPIIINVNNTGGAYAPMEQHPMGDHGHHGHHGHPSSNVTYTHELSEDAEKKLTKTMNFMEFVCKKSQS